MAEVFAGLDWASRTHAVCVIDERANVCKQWEVSHDADGLRELMRALQALGVRRIAIERPSGLLVDALVGQQQVVIKSLEANYRKVRGVSGATIMGDGHVALILDVPALAALAHSSMSAAA